MVRTGTGSVSLPSAASRAADLGSPQVSRLRRARWLDPRLITGVLLVLGSVVVGSRVIAAADQTVPVLAAATDLAPGQPLTAELVETRDVVLDGNDNLYYTGDLGRGYVVVRPVGAGELLPRASVAAATDSGALRYVTIPLPAAEVPAGLARAAVVDVWRIPPPDAPDRTAARLLAGVGVTAADSGDGGLAAAGGQVRVTLAVTAPDGGDASLDRSVATLLAAARDGLVYLTVVPEGPR